MPVSTERHSGFSVSKWELKYLRCRYIAHRKKIATVKPAIDAGPPPTRPHVQYKKKKALQEHRRQVRVVQENLRILDRTMNIMASSSDMPTHFAKARSTYAIGRRVASSVQRTSSTLEKETQDSSQKPRTATSSSSSSQGHRKQFKYFDRPLTARLKRNTHIIFRWFIQRFGKYVPWWAEINY